MGFLAIIITMICVGIVVYYTKWKPLEGRPSTPIERGPSTPRSQRRVTKP
jgi:hypothetical protein